MFLEYEADYEAGKQFVAKVREGIKKPNVPRKSTQPCFSFPFKGQFNAKEAEEFHNNQWQKIKQEQKENPQTISIASP